MTHVVENRRKWPPAPPWLLAGAGYGLLPFLRSLSSRTIVAVLAALLPWTAQAQLAPTGGHYGGRPSDTGFSGPVNATGGFSASVPIDLPVARGDLPVPFEISYGARGVGAAGLGWEIPLSYVRRDTTVAHRRPTSGGPGVTARPQVTLSLQGRLIEFISNGGTTWIARRDAPSLLLREQAGSWVLYDGQGRTYTFTQPVAISGTGLWLLTTVTGAGGSRVLLEYGYDTLAYGGGSALTINLLRVSWNFHPGMSCAKHALWLSYGVPTTTPLSLAVVGTSVVGRNRVVVNLDLRSRATCADEPERLRQYLFGYSADADTQLPRLASVKLRGRKGTAEELVELPVASYTYGTATTDGKLVYETWPTVRVPFDADGTEIASTDIDFEASLPPAAAGNAYSTWQTLTDVTGDGRPDLVYRKTGKLWVAQNRPIVGGGVTFTTHTSQAQLHDSTFTAGPFELRSLQRARIGGDPVPNIEEVWRQSIDVNGDGRMDVIDAGESANRWIIYVNTPSDSASGVTWVKRSWSTAALRQYLIDRGHAVQGYVPLARRHTGHGELWGVCVRWNGSAWEDFPEGWGSPDCAGVPQGLIDSGPERTFTEWEVTDFNGDGYPDVLMNSSPVRKHEVNVPPPPSPNGSQLLGYGRKIEVQPTTGNANRVDVAFNRRGVMFDVDLDQFTPPSNVATDLCGVAMWVDEAPAATTDPSTQRLACGHVDVNGDGLLDRVRGASARLGTGLSFSGISVRLPGSLSVQKSKQLADCVPFARTYPAWHEAGLRDMTGDGLPDYVDARTFPTRVSIGTGVGFTPPVPVDLGTTDRFIHLSNETEDCGGTHSKTTSGVYDVDGDGVADLVSVASSTMRIRKLVGGIDSGAAGAGRLTRIENGYGARTTVTYASAKDEGLTRHQVPFPEIVVAAVETAGTQNLGGDLAKVRYAYGAAEQFFDFSADRFVFPGYGRRLELRVPTLTPTPLQQEGQLIVTDAWELAPFVASPKEERFGRYLRAGRTKDVTVVEGLFNLRVEQHLLIDVAVDGRRTSMSHYLWSPVVVEEPSVPSSGECFDVMHPYDWRATFVANATHPQLNVCTAHGFVYARSNDSWRGTVSPPSQNAVATRSEVWSIDRYARPLLIRHDNDVNRGDDDFCVELHYPVPAGTNERVLSMPSSRRVTSCPGDSGPPVIWAAESWEYDGLAVGAISTGRPTGHVVERRATSSGALLNAVRTYDATYDLAANPVTVTTTREDGAQRTVTFDYDPFGLQVVRTRTNAIGIPELQETITLDSLSLEPLTRTDSNATQLGLEFDGFGRVTRTTIKPSVGALGVLSATSYLGFSGVPPLARTVVTTRYQDPVAPSAVGSAVGRVATGYFDELGRPMRTEVELGADYANETMVVGARLYDSFGRVRFEADPFPMSQGSSTAYGTSYHFRPDGTPWCFVRGKGAQPLTIITDPPNEVFPTCYSRFFSGFSEFVTVRDAASLLAGSNQDGTIRYAELSALGRLVSGSTFRNGVRLEHATFSHDRLGQLTAMARYLDPATPANPVQTTWTYDSLGQVTQWQEPESAAQSIIYSNWGEQLEVQWLDATVSPSVNRQVKNAYDALGRVTHREERNNGVTDPDSVFDYFYDVGTIVVPQVTPTHLVGRLARAKAPTGDVYLSYDTFGRVNARVFTDPQLTKYVEKTVFHGDGALRALQFFLPDNDFLPEQVDYVYDSAARLRTVKYADAAGPLALYDATHIDAFGRVRSAKYGGSTTYSASWTDTGRRLMTESRVDSPQGSRRIEYTAYDPIGRQLTRREHLNDDLITSVNSYDALGRLVVSHQGNGTGTTLQSWTFGYDALGNAVRLNDLVASADAEMSQRTIDRDRLCRIGYGDDGLGGTACNVVHDAVGNVVRQPTRTSERTLDYFGSGAVRRIAQGSATATFKYDPFGSVQALDVTGVGAGNTRHDRRYGGLLERRDAIVNGSVTSVVVRQVPGAGGLVASKRGQTWVFPFAEQRGSRHFVDRSGVFVQDVAYQPYGEATSTGAQPGSVAYSADQWNGGDALEVFGLSHLGARLYDPVIGRFLSRDPLLVPGTAASTNPYAFARNDPINRADPSGLDCIGPECHPPGGGGHQVPGGGPSPINDPCLYVPCSAPPGGASPLKSTYSAPDPILTIPEGWSDRLVSVLPPVTITQPPWAKRDYSDDPVMRGVPPPIGWFLRTDDPDSGMPPIFTFLQTILAAGQAATSGPLVARELIQTPVRFAVAEARAGASVAAAGSVGSGTGKLGATLAAQTSNAMRGTWTAGTARGTFTLRINQVGGKLFTTRGGVSMDDFARLVDEALSRNEFVNILSGAHGWVTGRMAREVAFFIDDMAAFARPGVVVWNIPNMTTSQITWLLNSTETTIGAFCYSGVCLRPYMVP